MIQRSTARINISWIFQKQPCKPFLISISSENLISLFNLFTVFRSFARVKILPHLPASFQHLSQSSLISFFIKFCQNMLLAEWTYYAARSHHKQRCSRNPRASYFSSFNFTEMHILPLICLILINMPFKKLPCFPFHG